uniref:Uncharacterized protein n=1 Tax=Ditylenchus dipsaci TaxID=166011 RepID=A0A915E1F8_9BILA
MQSCIRNIVPSSSVTVKNHLLCFHVADFMEEHSFWGSYQNNQLRRFIAKSTVMKEDLPVCATEEVLEKS